MGFQIGIPDWDQQLLMHGTVPRVFLIVVVTVTISYMY